MLSLPALAVSTLRISTPYAAGALGGTLSERGGVVNIALEGIMLGAAFAYVVAAWRVGRMTGADAPGAAAWAAPLAGLAAGILAGVALSAVHALATVRFKADNILSGLAINIFALGATNFLLKRIFDSASTSEPCPTFPLWAPFDTKGALAPLNLLLHPLIGLTLLLFIASHFLLYRTRFGLRLRAVGENPHAADSLGVSVGFYRTAGVLLGGAAASLGGIWLAADQGRFTTNMTGGRGYIALAAMIIGKWRPLGAAAACLVFGLAESLQNILQVARQSGRDGAPNWIERIADTIPNQAIQAFPYLLTIVVIAGLVGRSTPPAADGIPFEKEKA